MALRPDVRDYPFSSHDTRLARVRLTISLHNVTSLSPETSVVIVTLRFVTHRVTLLCISTHPDLDLSRRC
jgi:hypothetical protein